MTIATRIRQLRRERGLTQEHLGELCGASKSAVSQWESGDTLPTLQNIMAMTATVHGFVRAFAILTALFELLLIAILLASGSDPSSFRPR